MSTTTFDTAINQARDLLRWRSPLRTELWAARLTAELAASGQVQEFLRRAADDDGQEARLALAALASVNGPAEAGTPLIAAGEPAETGTPLVDADDPAEVTAPSQPYTEAGAGVAESLPGWVRRMGRVACDHAWYGKADPYGEQVLAVLGFRYDNGKEPHVLVVGIDQPNGGLAVDALVEEEKFLDELDLRPADPGWVARRVLNAFELTGRVMGARVADTLPAVEPFAIARARSVAGKYDVSGTETHDQVPGMEGLPGHILDEMPGAREAFGKLVEFVGDRPLWWSPARVSQFLTQWLPREAILSDEAIAAMPEVVRAWTRHHGDHSAVRRRIDEDAPRLPLLMADDSLASLNKRLARAAAGPHPQHE
ncbi:hypothetical protein [Nonomuraea gerenzanensis]|uniref:hypothetical protein n=1 Tax=Nonomuraea gerenzanensis TaxID=93944 RepID=UPI001CD9894E|nr:hypothetical protein [Nonomuraea gerenzanensis]UBU11650.1 hypothetical protein LCN96_46330 [Nonomuraea gerenzanensis]